MTTPDKPHPTVHALTLCVLALAHATREKPSLYEEAYQAANEELKRLQTPGAATPDVSAVAWQVRFKGTKDRWSDCSREHHDWVLRDRQCWGELEARSLAVLTHEGHV